MTLEVTLVARVQVAEAMTGLRNSAVIPDGQPPTGVHSCVWWFQASLVFHATHKTDGFFFLPPLQQPLEVSQLPVEGFVLSQSLLY